MICFFLKQKTAYEMRISDWSSDVCSSDLVRLSANFKSTQQNTGGEKAKFGLTAPQILEALEMLRAAGRLDAVQMIHFHLGSQVANVQDVARGLREASRSEEHTSELQSLMRISYAVFCLKKKKENIIKQIQQYRDI